MVIPSDGAGPSSSSDFENEFNAFDPSDYVDSCVVSSQAKADSGSDSIESAETAQDAMKTKSKAKPETSANDIAEEEASLVGEWDVKTGYNMGEGPSGIGDDPSMTLRLNEDLTGSLVDGPESYDFTWRYIGTNPAKYDSSVYYKNYECELSPGVKPPEGNSMEEFTIDVEVDDDNAIYLKFGDWLYYCERE